MNAVTPERIHAQAIGKSASQATEVERSRAVAQVQAAFLVAMQRPRDEQRALEQALASCRTKDVAEGAFYKFKRGNQTVSDASIHLARELARVWGNIDYGIAELNRNDAGGESEMIAFATDLQTNTRSSNGFIVPHRRDTKEGPRTLVDVRDIYENNANMGARRLRECIFAVLPPYLKEAAKAECFKALRDGGDKPIQIRVKEALEGFKALGISRERLEAKHGPASGWNDVDIANLKVSYRSVERREIDPEEEFPRVAADEATNAARRLVDQTRQDTVTDDNPAAAEGKGDEDRGEAHVDDDHPARRIADAIINAFETAGNIIDLANLKAARKADIDAMPDDIRAEVDAAYGAAEAKLKAPKK